MFVSGDMCMDIKGFVWLWSAFTPPKVRAAGLGRFFPIHTNAVCMWPVKPGNETGFADWQEEEKLDSPWQHHLTE